MRGPFSIGLHNARAIDRTSEHKSGELPVVNIDRREKTWVLSATIGN